MALQLEALINKFSLVPQKSNLVFYFLLMSLGMLGACARPEGFNKGHLKISFPTAEEFKSKLSKTRGLAFTRSAISYDNLCFAVNVKGEKISSTQGGQCEIEKGMIHGSVQPGSEISLTLDKYQTVAIEIYGFLRNSTSEQCPQIGTDSWSWPQAKTYLIDSKSDIAIEREITNVEFSITLPASENNIALHNSWPLSCTTPNAAPPPSMGRVGNGSAILAGTNFKMYVRSSSVSDLPTLSGTHFQIKGWRPK